jgi:YegS/Rv2252/BmrU family lipid kinase
MAKIKKQAQAAPPTLAEVQAKYSKRLKKVERAAARLDKQQQKLAAVEEALARLGKEAAKPALAEDSSPNTKLKWVSVIVNPMAKSLANGTHHLEEIVLALQEVGIQAEVGLKASGKVARRLARAAVERGDPLVIVAGGDGTIEDVVPELVNSSTALGILPLGNMNNLARSLGVPFDLHQACLLLTMGTTRHIDVGRIEQTGDTPATYFLEMAGVGLSALAAPMGQDVEKGHWTALLGKLGRIVTAQAIGLTITLDEGQALQVKTHVVTLSNAPLFGNNLLLAPHAKMDDGWLDLAFYEEMDKLALESYFLQLASDKPVAEARVHFQRVRRVRITAVEPLAANADLTVLAKQLSWQIEVLPGALAVVAGNGPALTLPVAAAPPPPPLFGPPPSSAEGRSTSG